MEMHCGSWCGLLPPFWHPFSLSCLILALLGAILDHLGALRPHLVAKLLQDGAQMAQHSAKMSQHSLQEQPQDPTLQK